MRNRITSQRKGKSNIRTTRRILATGHNESGGIYSSFSPLFLPSPPFSFFSRCSKSSRPTLRIHARHALRLGRSISANGDYIFQPGTHPTSDVNTARWYTPRCYFPYSLLIALAILSTSSQRIGHSMTMIVMVPALGLPSLFPSISRGENIIFYSTAEWLPADLAEQRARRREIILWLSFPNPPWWERRCRTLATPTKNFYHKKEARSAMRTKRKIRVNRMSGLKIFAN